MIDDIIDEYSSLIKSISHKFYNIEKEDLYQAGCLGLIKAYKNYKSEYGLFSSYAYKYIFGEMYELSIKSRDVKINKYYMRLFKSMNRARELLEQKLGHSVTNQEISEYLNISLDEIDYITFLMNKSLELDSLDFELPIKQDINYLDQLIINDSINSLDPLSSKVIKYRYFDDLTQSEVGNIMGINQVKVSRVEEKAKKRILEYIS